MKTSKMLAAVAFAAALSACGGGGAAGPTPLVVTKAQLVPSIPAPVVPKGASSVDVVIGMDVVGEGITSVALKNETTGKTITVGTASGIGSGSFSASGGAGTIFTIFVGTTTIGLYINNTLIKELSIVASCIPGTIPVTAPDKSVICS